MNKSLYVDSLHSDTTTLAAAARLGVGTALPCCPGWTVARLLGHLGAIYISINKNIRLEVMGDASLIDRYFELVPPD